MEKVLEHHKLNIGEPLARTPNGAIRPIVGDGR